MSDTPRRSIEDLCHPSQLHITLLLARVERRQTRRQDDYLCLTLCDRSGQIEGRLWQEVERYAPLLTPGALLDIEARTSRYQEQLQLHITHLEPLEAPSPERLLDYLPQSATPPTTLLATLRELLLHHVHHPTLRALLLTTLEDEALCARLVLSPAAKRLHHAYLGGLLEHTLSMARVALMLGAHYQRLAPGWLDQELLLMGCLFHDIGKCQELSAPFPIDYTTEGLLIGHIVAGVELLNTLSTRLPPTLDRAPIERLKHLVLSHHGSLEHGSPVPPRTPEALLLHQIDLLDSRMQMCAELHRDTFARDDAPEAPTWSATHRALGTRYLLTPASAHATSEPLATSPEAPPNLSPPPEATESPARADQARRAPLRHVTLDLFQ